MHNRSNYFLTNKFTNQNIHNTHIKEELKMTKIPSVTELIRMNWAAQVSKETNDWS